MQIRGYSIFKEHISEIRILAFQIFKGSMK
jgi:hypothetical protein